jgi:hypothetical protein
MNRIIIDANKRAVLPWKIYQQRAITPDELEQQRKHPKAHGEAIICGAVSGNIEVIDCDLKYDHEGKVREGLLQAIPEAIRDKLQVVQTRSGGWHLYYRCPVIAGNMKLAQRPTTEAEQNGNPADKVRVLIETRGEGGYVAAPPTPGYVVLSGQVGTLTEEERESLLEVCRSFNEYVEPVRAKLEPVASGAGAFRKSPLDHYNEAGVDDMLNLLQEHGWSVVAERGSKVIFKRPGQTDSVSSGDYHRELNLFSVFTTSTEFEPGKGYSPAAVFNMLIGGGDWKRTHRLLMDAGYGEKRSERKDKAVQLARELIADGLEPLDALRYVQSKTGMDAKQAQEVIEEAEHTGDVEATFWTVSDKGAVKIDVHKLYRWLYNEQGFGLYWVDDDYGKEWRLIQVRSKIMREATTEIMIKAVNTYLRELPDMVGDVLRSDIERAFMEGSPKLFGPIMLEHLDRHDVKPLAHDKDTAYFPFLNGVAVVKGSDNVTLISYNDAPGHIWERHIIKHRFDPDANMLFSLSDVTFYQFIKRISGMDEARTAYAMQLIGYILHGYKHPARSIALVLCEETEDEDKGGGTGKGLFYKAIGHVIRTVTLDGKNFKMDKSFAMQRVELDTQMVLVEDCNKNLNFEGFYSMITEGVTIEKKNQPEVYLSYAQAPKFGFSTNYTVNIQGNHGHRRVRLLEFSSHYGAKLTPEQEFGHVFFTDWDSDEWNRFYNFMLYCVQDYILNGVSHQESSESLMRKRIKVECGVEFADYWFDLIEHLDINKFYAFSEMYNELLSTEACDERYYTKKRVAQSVQKAAEYMGIPLKKLKVGNQKGYYIGQRDVQ